MAIQVLEAEDADMYRVAEIGSLAFARNEPLYDIFWPLHWTEAGRRSGSERMKNTKNTDSVSHYLKAVNSEGVIVGMAKWNIYDNHIPDFHKKDEVNHWDSEEEMNMARQMGYQFLAERRDAVVMSGGNLVSLDVLAIDPAYQRQGVGGALVAWGTKKADEMGVEAVVESSVYGKGLYEKNGFVWRKQVVVPTPKGFVDRGNGEFAWLVRPKKT